MSSVIRAVGEKLVRAKEWIGEAIEKHPIAAKVAMVALAILAIAGVIAVIGLTLGWDLAALAGVAIVIGGVFLANRLFGGDEIKNPTDSLGYHAN
jgi:hypothetical protein